MMKKLIIFLLFAGLASAHTITLEKGDFCRSGNFTITAEGFDEGCYDVKVEMTVGGTLYGKVFDEKEGWQSSFYYANSICIPSKNSTEIKIITDDENNFTAVAKLRSGNKIFSSAPQEIHQNCAKQEDEGWALVASGITIVIVLFGLTAYIKRRD